MTTTIPQTMRALVAPRKCKPSEYEVIERPVPSISLPTHVLIKVRAAAIEVGELRMAAGELSMFYKAEYPYPLCAQGSGVIVAIGSGVKNLKVGDEVYGLYSDKPMFRFPPPGFAAEYALAEERFMLIKPPHLSFEEVVPLAAAVSTAYKTIRRGLQIRGEESLEGKTVFVSSGLGSNGAMAIQVAKNVFGAKKIITTVSTAKVARVEESLPGLVDQVIDYTKEKPADVVPKGSVDLAYNTQFSSLDACISVLNRQTGTLMSIAGAPSKATVREMLGADRVGWLFCAALDLAQLWYVWKLWGTNIRHEMVSGGTEVREDLEKVGEIIALGKVKSLVSVVDLDDIEEVRRRCEGVIAGKGGFGKLVVRIS